MRKEAKKRKTVQIASVQGYHSGAATDVTGNYAFRGFTGNWYFNSDRKEKVKLGDNGIVIRENGQPFAGYGLEIETECTGIKLQRALADVYEKIIFPVFKFGADMFKMQNDISLGGLCNAEVITQVMTKKRIRNDYSAYKVMFDEYFPAFGISADSYTTKCCGMHVNVSNGIFGKTEEEQADAIRKLFYFVNSNYKLSCKLFYRHPMKTDYCQRMDYSNARNLDLYSASASHGNCMNLSHFREGRIEIRLVGGQKDYYCFRNTMETIFFLCERIHNVKWDDLDNPVKVFSGCNRYVFKRLSTECGSYITPAQLAAIQAKVDWDDDCELER